MIFFSISIIINTEIIIKHTYRQKTVYVGVSCYLPRCMPVAVEGREMNDGI